MDGTATFRMARGELETELTVFVPPDEPAGVYLLTVRNRGDAAAAAAGGPVLPDGARPSQPESAGPLTIRHDPALNALFFANPRNTLPHRAGVRRDVRARPSASRPGGAGSSAAGRGVARPALVEQGEPDAAEHGDDRPIAAFLATLDVPARGEATVVVVLGQADDRAAGRGGRPQVPDPGRRPGRPRRTPAGGGSA